MDWIMVSKKGILRFHCRDIDSFVELSWIIAPTTQFTYLYGIVVLPPCSYKLSNLLPDTSVMTLTCEYTRWYGVHLVILGGHHVRWVRSEYRVRKCLSRRYTRFNVALYSRCWSMTNHKPWAPSISHAQKKRLSICQRSRSALDCIKIYFSHSI